MNINYYKAGLVILLSAVLNFMLVNSSISGTEITKDMQTSKLIKLAKGGVTEYVIVESENPSQAERTAASELAKFLKKTTGAEFKIVKEKPEEKLEHGIYVGWTRFAAHHGIIATSFAPEEWSVITVDDNIVITGGRLRGTLNGVYEFLEESIGIYLLDPWTEIIPFTADLMINAPKLSGKPAFLYHYIYAPYGNFSPENKEAGIYFYQFNKNEVGNSLQWGTAAKEGSPGNCHTLGLYIHPDKYGILHPEYFSMNEKGERLTDAKGTRNMWFDLCLSNPKVREIIIGQLRNFIEADRKTAKAMNLPAPFIYNIDANDCITHGCLCPNCKVIINREDAESGLMVDFINEIADNIKAEYPDILLQVFAYNYTLKVPKLLKPRDNVIIRWCDKYSMSEFSRPLTHEYNKEMRDLFEPWCKISNNMAVWDYWRVYKRHAPGFYVPLVNISCLKPDLEYFQANGVKSIFIECEDFDFSGEYDQFDDLQSFHPLRIWLGLKLMQNPQRDEKKLLDVFFNGYYGPAAGKMREFLSYIELRQNACKQKLINLDREDYYKAYLDIEFFSTARKLLDEAETACGNDPFYRARVLRELIPVDSALLHLEPSLRKAFCASGEPFPFDRTRVLSEYASAWNTYMDTFMSVKALEKVKPFVEKRLEYLRTMPMSTLDSIRHNVSPVADGAILIDGVLNESAWTKADKIFLTPYEKMQELKVKTIVRTLWSKDKLYLAFECFDDNIRDMKFQQRKQDDPDIWKDSSVEIFINPSGDRSTYYHFIVNPAGVMTDAEVKTIEGQKDYGRSWNGGAETAGKINDNSWIVEMAIPWKNINFTPKEGVSLVCNFCRSRYLNSDDKAMQLQTWSPFLTTKGYHDIEKFGKVTLAGKSNGVLFASWEGPRDMPSFSPTGPCVAAFSKERTSDGETSLRLEFKKSDDFLGITVKVGDLSDWSDFVALKADIFVEGSENMDILIRLLADNTFYNGISLKPGWNKDVSLVKLNKNMIQLQKKIDLTKMKDFLLYVAKGKATKDRVIFLDNLRLVYQ